MSARFCPDCGAECQEQEDACRECEFPLVLRMFQYDQEVAVPRHEMPYWNRIAQLLRRNGIRVVVKAAPRVSSRFAWVFLPGFGLLIFICCLFFGDSIVSSLWGNPPKAAASVLDLSQKKAKDSNSEEELAKEGGSDVDVSFLQDALRANETQKYASVEDEVSSSQYIDKQSLGYDEVLKTAQKCLVLIQIENTSIKGLYLGHGQVLTNSGSLEAAFMRGSRILKNKDGYQRVTEMIVPKLMFPGKPGVDSGLVLKSEEMGVALLSSDLEGESKSNAVIISYDESLYSGKKLWMSIFANGKVYLEPVRVTTEISWGENLTMFKIDKTIGNQNAGTPMLDEMGRVVGLGIVDQGEEMVLSLLTLRERGPQLYKEIQDK